MSTAASAAQSSTKTPVRGFARFWRALKQLFYELAGAAFAVLGLAWVNATLRSWKRDVSHWLIAIAVAVAVLFFVFSWTSFRRAKRLG